jgi:hypothetical protein
MWNKLVEDIKYSSLALAGILVITYGTYAVWPESGIKEKVFQTKGTKPVEEIIAGSYTKDYKEAEEWDSTFTSAIIPIEDKNGN